MHLIPVFLSRDTDTLPVLFLKDYSRVMDTHAEKRSTWEFAQSYSNYATVSRELAGVDEITLEANRDLVEIITA